jgi:Flp pilus assembly protein TadG
VEFALVLPILMCLLLGMLTAGFALSQKNSVTNAVREGARLGATLPEGTSWDTWATLVRDRVVDVSGGDVENDEVCVQIKSWSGGSGATLGSWPAGSCPLTAAPPSVPASTPDGTCVVLVWARMTATLEAFFFSRDLTMDARAVGQYERSECP